MYESFLWKLLLFHTEIFPAKFLWGSVLPRGELQKYAKNSNFENFQSALYSTSVSMPLTNVKFHCSQNFSPYYQCMFWESWQFGDESNMGTYYFDDLLCCVWYHHTYQTTDQPNWPCHRQPKTSMMTRPHAWDKLKWSPPLVCSDGPPPTSNLPCRSPGWSLVICHMVNQAGHLPKEVWLVPHTTYQDVKK